MCDVTVRRSGCRSHWQVGSVSCSPIPRLLYFSSWKFREGQPVVVVVMSPSGAAYMGGQMSRRDEEFLQTLIVLEYMCDISWIAKVTLAFCCPFLLPFSSKYHIFVVNALCTMFAKKTERDYILDQKLIPYCYSILLLFLLFLLESLSLKRLRLRCFQIGWGMKLGTIILQINTYWLMESDPGYDVILSRCAACMDVYIASGAKRRGVYRYLYPQNQPR